ncbi:MAG: phage portal protein [Alphaproteobacteria bacterium]|nr:phage portal protein [Alphaproteobacteria bacterium]
MKLPWSKPEMKSGESWIALAGLPDASWGRTDPATLVREGYAGNAIVYRCARMIAEAAASIALQCQNDAVQKLLTEPSPEQSGQALIERLYIDLQITGNAWAEAVTLPEETVPRALFGLRADAVRVRQDDRGHVSGYPIVMNAGRAQLLAERRLMDLRENISRSIALPPAEVIGLEALDRLDFDGAEWIVDRIEELGLQRHLRLRPARSSATISRSIEVPSTGTTAIVPADPVLEIVDGPSLDHLDGSAVFAAASGDPWAGSVSLKMGEALDSLLAIATLQLSTGMGQLLNPLEPGPLGRWDYANVIDVYMPGEEFSSASEDSVLSGTNRLLLKNDLGWELVSWRDAELIGVDQWRLSALVRGIAGSPVLSVPSEAVVVLADDRLTPLSFSDEDIGRTLLAQIGSGEVLPFEYQDRASLPWRVGHLRIRMLNGEHIVSWTGRGSQFSNNWELAEVEHEQQFVIELYLNDTLVSRAIQSETELGVSLGAADTVRVAIMSAQGRVGEWGSIPV